MCGIFGYTNFHSDELNLAREALHTMKHRGPDQWGEFCENNVYLGHRRLSIIDLSDSGKQPMCNDKRNVFLTVNGEIYNYPELKKQLSEKYEFKSSSDSEVLLHGYSEWGIDGLLHRIDGMFSICIYDSVKNKIFLVRDRIGIKPLYYSTVGNRIAWASELKAIQKFFGSHLEVDSTAFYDYLTYLYVPAPKTMYKNVFKLEPAHYLDIDISTNKISKNKYWSLNCGEKNISVEDAKTELKHLVMKSVKEQMMSDVPVGFFLSGGMDSSIVVASAAQLKIPLNTFSIGFDDKKHNETHFAKLVAEYFNCNHLEKILDRNSAASLFNKMKSWYDEPFADTSAFPSFLVSEFAHRSATVVLTGDGGDEVFGGYNWYRQFEKFNRHDFSILKPVKSLTRKIKKSNSPYFLKRVLNRIEYQFLLNGFELYTKLMGGLIKPEKKEYAVKWNIPDDYDDYWYFRKFYKEELPLYTRLQYLDFHTYLPDDILTKVDRVSMAVSLEARVPLLSRQIIEYAFSLPQKLRYHKGNLKGLFKESFSDLLPQEILKRNKKGFSIPIHSWRKNILKNYNTKQEALLAEFMNR